MKLQQLINEKNLSIYACSKQCGIPYTTLFEILNGKNKLGKCKAETVYKLAKFLNVPMETLLEDEPETENTRADFETFKGNVCHLVKDKGDLEFIIETLQKDDIHKFWERKWYRESFYLLAMVDYLSRENQLPLCEKYNEIRNCKLPDPIYPRDISLTAKLDRTLDLTEQCKKDAIPEFMRFNIVERNIRDVR